MRTLTALLSLSLAFPALAQDKPACCEQGQKATACAAESPAKALAALTAEVKALPAERKAELSAAAKTLTEQCPVGQGALVVLGTLHGTAKQVGSSCCAAMPAGSHDGEGNATAEGNQSRVTALAATIDAHVALLAELGLPIGKAACCEAAKKDAKECCEGDDPVAKLEHCTSAAMQAIEGIPAKAKAIDAPTHAKIMAAAEVLTKAKIAPAMHGAFAYYGRELNALATEMDKATVSGERAAEGGCPAGEEMAVKAESMAKVTGQLAALTGAFLKAAAAAGGKTECCAEGETKECCEAGKAEGKECCEKKAAAAGEKKSN